MEKIDHELLMQIAPTHPELKKLYQQHIKLEKQVERFEQYARYSSSAALRHKELKKEKLKGKESMMSILKLYRHQGNQIAA